MQPIRSERTRKVASSSWDASDHPVQQDDTDHTLSQAGAIESDRTTQQMACHCGCLRPPAGFCAECNQLICEVCYARCSGCNKPIGPCHYVKSQDRTGRVLVECRSCNGARKRKSLITGLWRGIASLVIDFEDER